VETGLPWTVRGAMLKSPCGANLKCALLSPLQIQPTGAFMKFSISYKHVESHEAVEADTAHSVEKLSRLLKFYEPDLVQLHGVFSKNPHKEEHSFSLNLSLPTGTLHATGTAETVRAACKVAFAELESQVKKHQSRLRHDHEWKRKQRPRLTPPLPQN
jgi:ribosomal subunit interface protein